MYTLNTCMSYKYIYYLQSQYRRTTTIHSSHPGPTQNKSITLPQIILTQIRCEHTYCPLFQTATHTTPVQLHTHRFVASGFVKGSYWSGIIAGYLGGPHGWSPIERGSRTPASHDAGREWASNYINKSKSCTNHDQLAIHMFRKQYKPDVYGAQVVYRLQVLSGHK